MYLLIMPPFLEYKCENVQHVPRRNENRKVGRRIMKKRFPEKIWSMVLLLTVRNISEVGPCCPDGERVSDGEDL